MGAARACTHVTRMARIKRLFIVLPSISGSSPVKGAAALANELCGIRSVTTVGLKSDRTGQGLFDPRVTLITLGSEFGFHSKIKALRKIIAAAGESREIASLSMCFSADLSNSFCNDLAVTLSSVRGNLLKNYATAFGWLGYWIAYSHFRILRRIKHVVSMSQSMATQVSRHVGCESPIIGNFVDEYMLESYRAMQPANHRTLRLVFAGSLTTLKCPLELIEAIAELQRRGIYCELHMLGDGPLRSRLLSAIGSLIRPSAVRVLGHIENPIAVIAAADALVLPSLTEGVSRAALEALFLGVPCVLRDVDGSSELIKTGFNGVLFRENAQLPDALIAAATLGRHTNRRRRCLLPPGYRQNAASQRFLNLMEMN